MPLRKPTSKVRPSRTLLAKPWATAPCILATTNHANAMIAAALDMRRMNSPRSAITQASIHAHGETTFATSKNANTAKTAVMPAITKATAAPSLPAAAALSKSVISGQSQLRLSAPDGSPIVCVWKSYPQLQRFTVLDQTERQTGHFSQYWRMYCVAQLDGSSGMAVRLSEPEWAYCSQTCGASLCRQERPAALADRGRWSSGEGDW